MVKKDNNYATREAIIVAWRYTKKHKREIGLIMLLGIALAFFVAVLPYLSGQFVDGLTDFSKTRSLLSVELFLPMYWAIIFIFAMLAEVFLRYFYNRIELVFARNLDYEFVVDATKGILSQPLHALSGVKSGELVTIVKKGASALDILVGRTFVREVPTTLSIIASILFASFADSVLLIPIIIGLFLYIVTVVIKHRVMLPKTTEHTKQHSKNWGNIQDIFSNRRTVLESGTEEYEVARVGNMFQVLLNRLRVIEIKIGEFWGLMQRGVIFLTKSTIVILALTLVSRGDITVGEFVAVLGYMSIIFEPIVRISGRIQGIQPYLVNLTEASKYMQKCTPSIGVLGETRSLNRVELQNVGYAYPNSEDMILCEVNLTLKRGNVLYVVGESGSGKSTLVDLISGLIKPTSGSVLYNGIEANELDISLVRKKIAIISQETNMLARSFIDNVMYGIDCNLEKNTIESILKDLKLWDIYQVNKDKTEMIERGGGVSGGQSQRILLARALLSNVDILILDEPTTSLDNQNSSLVIGKAIEGAENRITIIVTHNREIVDYSKMVVHVKDKSLEMIS